MCFYTVPRQPTRRLQGVPEGSGSHWRALHPARSRWPGSDPGPRPASSVRHSLNLCSDDGAAGIVSMPLLVTVLFFCPPGTLASSSMALKLLYLAVGFF